MLTAISTSSFSSAAFYLPTSVVAYWNEVFTSVCFRVISLFCSCCFCDIFLGFYVFFFFWLFTVNSVKQNVNWSCHAELEMKNKMFTQIYFYALEKKKNNFISLNNKLHSLVRQKLDYFCNKNNSAIHHSRRFVPWECWCT